MTTPVFEILESLENETKRNAKIEIIQAHKNNQDFIDVLKLALDDHITFYIKSIPDYDSTIQGVLPLAKSLSQLTIFSSRAITGNAALSALSKILENSLPENRSVLERVVKKDLRCGVAVGLVNKALGDKLVSKYPVMLASSYNAKNMAKIKYPAFGQVKSDGMRINILIDPSGAITFKSRTGKPMDVGSRWNHIFSGIPPGVMIDGEALVVTSDNKVLSRKLGNGILNKIAQGTASKHEIDSVCFVVWDVVPFSTFHNSPGKVSYEQRFDILMQLFPRENENINYRIKVSPTWIVETEELATELFQMCLGNGEEGIILKNFEGAWESKRSKHLVKMKAELDADLVVIGWQEGTGKYKGMLGSLECETSCGKLNVHVGSGFNEEQRKTITEDIIGSIIEVKYNELITNKNKKTVSLNLPIFTRIRLDEDKAEANALTELA